MLLIPKVSVLSEQLSFFFSLKVIKVNTFLGDCNIFLSNLYSKVCASGIQS